MKKNKSIYALCEIPSGTIISKGNTTQWIKQMKAAEAPRISKIFVFILSYCNFVAKLNKIPINATMLR